ncbi:lasso peptide biosynthesis B2 protein [Candidatus Thiosymbion oneisti]|uniref:lasso peptide biosynthesis B2 protein n=1 Tax=Candidatus Thiosymbion oneisti TaxID=589554 RepID=UPI00159F2AFA|nr:lasso peptide biosynthesis B2 protein [Candidatus Thiosymbion oneisti]
MPSIQTSSNGISLSAQKLRGLRRRWRGFTSLEPGDRLLFLMLWGQLVMISVLLRLLTLRRTRQLLMYLTPKKPGYPTGLDQAMAYAQRIRKLAWIASRHLPFDAYCLRQSVLIWWFLRRRGLAAELRIGVNNQEAFLAHAWVELEGRLVNESPDVTERYRPFDRVP